MSENECRKIRKRMRYSIAEMAEALGLKKATYQCYDEGSRSVPEAVLKAIRAEESRCQLWAKRYLPGGAFDKELAEQYPLGIRSDKTA